MTPEQARQLLEGTSPAPWCHEAQSEWWDEEEDSIIVKQGANPEVNPYRSVAKVDLCNDLQIPDRTMIANANLIAAAPDMAAMIANMRTEYAVQLADGRLVGVGWGTRETAECDRDAWRRDGYNARIVCRYVTGPQPLEGEHP